MLTTGTTSNHGTINQRRSFSQLNKPMFPKLFLAPFAFFAILIPVIALAQSTATRSGQAYPIKPIRLIVPFSPGGTNDILARMIATHLSQTLGEAMIVDNRSGGEGLIGTEIAVKARPDGYTLLLVSSAYVMNPAVRKLPFDSIKALDFIAKLGASFTILSVGPATAVNSVNSVKDLLAVAKSKPGELVLSTSGGFQYFASALFTSLSKHDFNIVLYKGAVPAMIDVIGGQVHTTFAVSVPALPHLRSGKLKGLAVGTLKRTELLPDIPTLDEAGVTGYDASNWYAIATAAGTPPAIVMKLHDEITRYFKTPEVQKQVTAMGAVIDLKTPDEMRKIIPADIAKWTKVAIDTRMPRDVN
jgi:tripartite-type tricarboxylate transporter receptor subunit TctC